MAEPEPSNLVLTIGLNQILHDRHGYEKYVGFIMPSFESGSQSQAESQPITISDIQLESINSQLTSVSQSTSVIASNYIESVECLSEIDLDFTGAYQGNSNNVYHKRKLSVISSDESSISPGFYIDENMDKSASIEQTIKSISTSQNRMHLYLATTPSISSNDVSDKSDSKSINWEIGSLFQKKSTKDELSISVESINESPPINWKLESIESKQSSAISWDFNKNLLSNTAILCNIISTYSNANIADIADKDETSIASQNNSIVQDIESYSSLITQEDIGLLFESDNDGITPLHLLSSCSIDGASKEVSDAYQDCLYSILSKASEEQVSKKDLYGNTFLHNLFSVNPLFCTSYMKVALPKLPNIGKYVTTIKDEFLQLGQRFTNLFKIKNTNRLIPYLCPLVSCSVLEPDQINNSRELRQISANQFKSIIQEELESKEGESIKMIKDCYDPVTELKNIQDNIARLDIIRESSDGYYEKYTLWMPSQLEIEMQVNLAIFPLYIQGCIFKGVPTKSKNDYITTTNQIDTTHMKGPISPIDETSINTTIELINGCMETFKNANALLAFSKIFPFVKNPNDDSSLPSKEDYDKLNKDRKAEFVFVINKEDSGYKIQLFISC